MRYLRVCQALTREGRWSGTAVLQTLMVSQGVSSLMAVVVQSAGVFACAVNVQ
jgi:hypothetical protein